MITTNTNIREMPTGLTTLPTIEFIDVTRSADARTWSGGDNRPFIETCLLKWKWLRVLLCVDDEWLEDVKLEASVRDKIRDELKLQQVGYSIDSVRMVTRAIYDTTKYDMSNYKMQEDAEALAMKEEEELRLSRERKRVIRRSGLGRILHEPGRRSSATSRSGLNLPRVTASLAVILC